MRFAAVYLDSCQPAAALTTHQFGCAILPRNISLAALRTAGVRAMAWIPIPRPEPNEIVAAFRRSALDCLIVPNRSMLRSVSESLGASIVFGSIASALAAYEPVDVLHVTIKADWQAMRSRGEAVLRVAEMPLRCRELEMPKQSELDEFIHRHRVKICFVHAFAIEAGAIIATACRFPAVQVVHVLHSEENHVMTWPVFFPQIADLLAASERLSNLWFANSESGQAWQRLGYDRVLQFYQPCAIDDYREPPTVDPPTVLITSRPDVIKAIPAQILAAAILQRERRVRLAVSVPHVPDKQPAIDALIAAAGLKADRWPWLPQPQFLHRLRNHVSLVLQPSLSESFNYVSWEAASVGRPWVGSAAIKHTPAAWRADPNDPADIARVAGEILDDYHFASRQARLIAENVAAEHNAGYCDLIRRLLS